MCMEDIFRKVKELLSGKKHVSNKRTTATVKGKVVLMKKNVLDFTDLGASIVDRAFELFGQHISIQFISATHPDPGSSEDRLRGKVGKAGILEDWITTISPVTAGESTYEITFEWDEEIGLPGAFLVKNSHPNEFYFKTLTLEDVPGHGQVHFVCNSWVYPTENYTMDRIFFANKAYLPSETPELLRPYREDELVVLRGNGSGMRQEWDRVYDYALYDDLAHPDDGRPIIGGSSEYPYPRRGRTGRPTTKSDPPFESRLSLIEISKIYVPRDERFGHLKRSDFKAYELEAVLKFILPGFDAIFDDTVDEFDSLQDVMKLYRGGLKLPEGNSLDNILKDTALQMFKELGRSDGEGLTKYSEPHVIRVCSQTQSLLSVTLIEILSRHTTDEIYLGKRECPEWTMDPEPLQAFEKFGNKLKEIEEKMMQMNQDERLKNRYGPVKVPYTLLHPSSEEGLTGRGIPNTIKTWVKDYCTFYYKTDAMVQKDTELQSWWKELREEGHGDLIHDLWWPNLSSVQDVTDNCTIIIWISSALHATVNFGQLPPNRPTLTRRLLPEPNTPEYDELTEDPENVFLKKISSQTQSLLSVTLIEILSRHTTDEIYLGQRECPEWTMDPEPLQAFEKFGNKLKEIEEKMMKMNQDERLKNRYGLLRFHTLYCTPVVKMDLLEGAFLTKVANFVLGENHGKKKKKTSVKGKVVLMKKNVLDFNDLGASVLDRAHELFGEHISIQFISATHADNASTGKLGKPAILEDWISTITPLTVGESTYEVTFDWDVEIGLPGAFLIQNLHHSEFYLMTLTLENVPGHGQVHFVCNSWVYPSKYYTKDRIFFANKAYLPSETPVLLRPYIEEEMVILRGDGTRMLEKSDRVYDYALYNDLGDPEDEEKVRPVIGGSSEYPYPRRGRTSRPPTELDPKTETRLSLLESMKIYVPRDERFGHLKKSDFLAYGVESVLKFLLPEFEALADDTLNEFDSFEDVMKLYNGGIKLPQGHVLDEILENISLQMFKELIRSDGEGLAKYSKPQVIEANLDAWSTDEEFAREMLAGVNPVSIQLLKEFPPTSKLDPKVYGNQNSSIREHHIKEHLDDLEVDKALKENRLFILDHHDSLMPYDIFRKVKELLSGKKHVSNTRTTTTVKGKVVVMKKNVLDFTDLGASIVDRAFELFGQHISIQFISATHPDPGSSEDRLRGKVGKAGILEDWITTISPVTAGESTYEITFEWDEEIGLPGAFLVKNSHPNEFYFKTLTLEDVPGHGQVHFVCNSWVYPTENYTMDRIFFANKAYLPGETPELLRPYREDELVVLRGNGSGMRQEWDRVYDYALYDDLAHPDDGRPIIGGSSEYPYPRRGRTGRPTTKSDPPFESRLSLIEMSKIYVPRDERFGHLKRSDFKAYELEAVLKFILPGFDAIFDDTVDEFDSLQDVMKLYRGGLKLPEGNSLDNILKDTALQMFKELGRSDGEGLTKYSEPHVIRVCSQTQSLLSVTLIEILSRHTTDEIYLGKRECPEWTMDPEPLQAFEKFGNKLKEIEEKMVQMNQDERLKNRYGPVKVPYTLLHPSSEEGLTGRGIPNIEDSKYPHSLRLTIEDYQYAVDGLEIWSAIKTWVKDYCTCYYKTDAMVQKDTKLQSWWKELREEGHDVTDNCTIIIWISSALHAAVNFGQYPLCRLPPNRPTLTRRLLPEPNTLEYDELTEDPENVFLKKISSQTQSLLSVTLIEIECPEWTMDPEPLQAFGKFGNKLKEIEEKMMKMNQDERLKNRYGPVKKVANFVLGENHGKKKKTTVKGKVVLMKKNVLDFNDLGASVLDRAHELFGEHISIQFISATHADNASTGLILDFLRGKLGKPAILEDWISTITPLTLGESTYEVTFDWDVEIGLPGAFLIQNLHHSEFYLMTLTLENVPGHGQVHFVCNSWVYPSKYYTKDRIFFANKAYLPSETPVLLRPYIEEEMVILRGDGTRMLEKSDRVYDYALYNDLGDPEDEEKVRPVIGGSSEYPYPRRGRTSRPPTELDPNTETRLSLLESMKIYVPRDERFGHLKKSDFLAYGVESVLKFLLPEFEALADDTLNEFDSFEDFMKLYNGGIKLPQGHVLDEILENISLQMFKELIRSDGEGLAKYSKPQVIEANLDAWSTDEEFAREMLAGVNPVSIQLLKEFPPTSKLDPKVYGNQNSSIREHHIKEHLDDLEVDKALKENRLFILDHHDSLMP
ncbi:hypothetical protein M8C21_005344, partial [Ambrosia artemisiifolia]